MSEQKKLIIAVVASLAFFFTMETFFPRPAGEAPVTATSTAPIVTQAALPAEVISSNVSSLPASLEVLPREQALLANPRVEIKTPKMRGSIRLKGAVVDDIELLDYKQTTDEGSPNVILYSPQNTKEAYLSTFTFMSSTHPNACPTNDTTWTLDPASRVLTPSTPIVLRARPTKAVEFTRTISVDENYLLTVRDTIKNHGKETVVFQPIGTISRIGKPQTSGFFVLHEGGVGVLNHSLSEVTYDDMVKKGTISQPSTGGWLGFTDKYWLSALIAAPSNPVTTVYSYQPGDIFQTKLVGQVVSLEPAQSYEYTQNLYTGAKVLRILDGYEASHGFDRFDLAVDFGWFFIVTKPLFYVLDFFNSLLGNMGYAILLLTILFKVFLLPLANKSHRSMARMKSLQPKMERLKEQYAADKMRLNQEIMALYKKEKVNPVSGCLPMLIQAPIFFCLYKVFFVTIEMRHAPFFGWIHDLAAPDPTCLFNLFGLLPWSVPSFMMIGAWPLLMGATMILQQRLGPQPTDPQQAKIMMIMPLMFTFMFASFPAGLVIYWAWSNVLTIAQQWYINSRIAATPIASDTKKIKGKK